MRDDLYNLLLLQEVDNEIDELHQHKKNYPARIDELERLIAEIEQDRQDKNSRLEELKTKSATFNQKLLAVRDALAKHHDRLSKTSNSREYEAVQQEIISLKQSADELEIELLKADEEADTLRQTVESEVADADKKAGEYQTEIEDLSAKTADIDNNVSDTMVRREEAAEILPKRLRMMYDRIRRGKSLAAARVVRGACSGCWKSLPPQQINELRRAERIIVCEGCGRILVWDDRNGNDPR